MKLVLSRRMPAPPGRVWEVLADWERYPDWMPDVTWVRPLGPERALGLRLAVRTRVFGVPAVTDTLRVTAWEPPRRMAIVHEGVVRGLAEWLVEPDVEGSTFTWTEDLRMRPPVPGELALRLYGPILRWTFARSIRNLEARLSATG